MYRDYRILKGGWFKREGPRDPEGALGNLREP